MYKHILWLRYSDISQLSLGFAVGQPLNLTHLQQTFISDENYMCGHRLADVALCVTKK